MEPMYRLLFEMLSEEVRHTLVEVREGRHKEAEHSLEAIERFLQLARAMHHFPFWRYEGRGEWQRWSTWRAAPEWLREQWRLRRAVGAVPWTDPMPWEPWTVPWVEPLP